MHGGYKNTTNFVDFGNPRSPTATATAISVFDLPLAASSQVYIGPFQELKNKVN